MGLQIIFRGTTPGDLTGDTAYVMAGKINAMFTELYGVTTPPITLANQTGTISQLIPVKYNVSKMYFGAVSGTPSVKCGTTPNGNDVFDTLTDFSGPIIIERDFITQTTLYFTINSGSVNIQIDAKPISV